jgi:hypothetical protein
LGSNAVILIFTGFICVLLLRFYGAGMLLIQGTPRLHCAEHIGTTTRRGHSGSAVLCRVCCSFRDDQAGVELLLSHYSVMQIFRLLTLRSMEQF